MKFNKSMRVTIPNIISFSSSFPLPESEGWNKISEIEKKKNDRSATNHDSKFFSNIKMHGKSAVTAAWEV